MALPMTGVLAEESRTGGLKLPLTTELTQLKMMCMSPYENLGEKQFFQELKKRTGVEVLVQSDTEDVHSQKMSTIMASGDLPDIMIGGITSQEINMYGEQGAFANVVEYLDQLPNVKRILFDDLVNHDLYQSYRTETGNAYLLPIYRLARDVNSGFMYRKDIFDKLGLEMWTDNDSFYACLQALKEAYPNSYPYGSKRGVGIFQRWGNIRRWAR